MSRPDVLVVGGGVVGCSVAYHLARAGASVVLLERDELAGHASGAAAGMLAPLCESTGEGPLYELGLRSLNRMPELAAELHELSGTDPQWVRSGVMRAAMTVQGDTHLREQACRMADHGLVHLTPEQVHHRVAAAAPGILGGLWSPGEGHVLSPHLARAFAVAAVAGGARVETGVTVSGLRRRGGRVVGVATAEGDRDAGHVVLCTGAWTRFCAEWLGSTLPIQPIRGQILSLDAPRTGLPCILWSEDVYLVPKLNGTVVVGATEEATGFDCRVTAGGVDTLLRAAIRLAPALADATFRHAWAGLRPDTPDHLPAIGPLPGVEGLTIAAGHYRNGVLLSSVTGELVTRLILRGDAEPVLDALRPGRFAG